MTSDEAIPATLGAILAGGRARRFSGGDKVLRSVGSRSILVRLVERLGPQVKQIVLNANDDPRRFGAFGLTVVADSLPDQPGPLAGVLAVLDWAAEADPATEWVVTVPGDAPFVPRDLVRRLHAGRRQENTVLAGAASQGRIHPVVAVWPVSVRDELRQAMAVEGVRKVDAFRRRFRCAVVDWPAVPVDPFLNINTPEDLAEADRLVALNPGL